MQYELGKITFGNGGGFAGIERSFVLLDNGKLYEISKMGEEFIFKSKIEKQLVSQIFQNYKFLNFDKIELNDPGNQYFFIEFSDKLNTKRMTWGNNKPDEKNVLLFYQILMNLINK